MTLFIPYKSPKLNLIKKSKDYKVETLLTEVENLNKKYLFIKISSLPY